MLVLGEDGKEDTLQRTTSQIINLLWKTCFCSCQVLGFFLLSFFLKKNKIEWYCVLHYTILVISLEIHFGKLLKGELSSFSPHVSPPIYFPFSLVLCGDSTTEIMHFQPLKVVSSYRTKKIISLTSLI